MPPGGGMLFESTHEWIVLLAQFFLKSGSQERQEGEQISDHTEAGYGKDRRFGIFVDGNHQFGGADPDDMLDGTRDAGCDVKIGRDHFAGLPNLVRVWNIPGIDRCARGADRTA